MPHCNLTTIGCLPNDCTCPCGSCKFVPTEKQFISFMEQVQNLDEGSSEEVAITIIPDCPYCSKEPKVCTKESVYRRGSKLISVETQFFECTSNCQGFDGESPLRFVSIHLMKLNDEVARKKWLDVFGEEPPKGRAVKKKD